MQEIAAQTLTPEQIGERADRTRALLSELFGHEVMARNPVMRRGIREAAAAHRAALVEAKSPR
ncbi:hypothetical protein ACFYO2_10655 [Streptomyces sp. NPDC006602]|uniref:hypothetical protein n=1 Tax=Streptomyces sp. NPDC006602 TaxID=3364751 RepID=UPI003689303C